MKGFAVTHWASRGPGGSKIYDRQMSTPRAAAEATLITIALLLAMFGLLLPFHDYAGSGSPVLDEAVSSDSLGASTFIAAVAVMVAGAALMVVWRNSLRWLAVPVLAVAVVNLGRLLYIPLFASERILH